MSKFFAGGGGRGGGENDCFDEYNAGVSHAKIVVK